MSPIGKIATNVFQIMNVFYLPFSKRPDIFLSGTLPLVPKILILISASVPAPIVPEVFTTITISKKKKKTWYEGKVIPSLESMAHHAGWRWSLEVSLLSKMELVHRRVISNIGTRRYSFIRLGGERHCRSRVSSPRTTWGRGVSLSSKLTIRPPPIP